MDKLTENDITEYFIQQEKTDELGGKIERRINEVIDLLCKAFKCHFEWGEYDEREFSLSEVLRYDLVNAGVFSGKLYLAYPDGFEKELLFMDNDQIVARTRDLIEEAEKKEAERKEKTKSYREKKKIMEQRLAVERKKIKKELGIK